MHAGKSILIVDDDPQARKLLQTYLSNVGFLVRAAVNGSDFRRILEETGADLVILDVTLPDESGFKLCQWMHEHPDFLQIPIIMLTGRVEEVNRVLGLELGADDYLCKPFSLRELLARINALLRRTSISPKSTAIGGQVLAFDEWQLDTVSRRLVHLDGEEVILTGTDFTLLKLFLDHPQQVLDRDTIGNATRGREMMPQERGVDTAVYRLRQRLRDTAKPPRLILTVRGGGYLLAAEVTLRNRA
ncbi:DNA-binding response regulator [Oxalicibacterium flavum]|uniref:DNA-binding response regulator n=1 Tax=Oxalicibacterium flavum TaxID=179467 RepID=A0A8J2UND6_9BURK|nr:response regulator transcription factor [Oxalicibacterium flavum]GGB95661.1 DNA-binding response regulator [Oxalicibacterium flavum]